MTEEEIDPQREFLDRRQTGIGATDSAKILGLSRWGSALTVYQDKVAPVDITGPSLPAWLGLELEGSVARLYTAQEGRLIRSDNLHHRHPDYDFIVCHLDYRAKDRLVEIKTASSMSGWGPEGSTEIPVEYWVQVQHEMLVTGKPLCDVAALFGHHTFRVYHIERDNTFLEALVPTLQSFWVNHVLAGVPPPPGHTQFDRKIIAERWPDDDGVILPATAEQELLLRECLTIREAIRDAEARKEEIENRLRDAVGAHLGIESPDATFTWKLGGPRTEWKALAADYRTLLESAVPFTTPLGVSIGVDDLDGLVTSYTKPADDRRISVREKH
jgi:putative phage-type endonuclease